MAISSHGVGNWRSYFMMSAVSECLAENTGTQNMSKCFFLTAATMTVVSILGPSWYCSKWTYVSCHFHSCSPVTAVKPIRLSFPFICRGVLFVEDDSFTFCGKAHQALNSLSLSCWRRAWTCSVSDNVVGRSSFCRHVSISLGKSW